MHWKRHRRKLFVGLVVAPLAALLCALFVGFPVVQGVRLLKHMRALAQRPRYPADAGQGPGAYDGVLTGRAHPTPGGRASVAWVAWVVRDSGTGRNRVVERICREWRLAGLALQGAAGAVDVALFDAHAPATLDDDAYDNSGSVLADFGPAVIGPMPQAFRECVQLHGAYGALTYHETWAPPGAPAVVSGCRDGAVIHACGDGADVVTLRSTRAVAARWWARAKTQTFVGAVLAGMATCGLWALFGWMRVRLVREPSPPRPAGRPA